MVKLMRGLAPKSVPNFTTSDNTVLGAAIDSHGRRRCIIIINIAGSSDAGSSAKCQNIFKMYIIEGQELDDKRAKLLHVGPTTT